MKTRFCLIVAALILLVQQGWSREELSFFANPLTINGHPLEHQYFSIHSQGVLALVVGDPRTPNHKPVPFRVSIQRGGATVRQWPAKATEPMYSVQLNSVWPYARFGDELVIEPSGTSGGTNAAGVGKRIIKLKPINWFLFLRPTGDGC